MKVLKLFNTLKLTSCIRLPNQFGGSVFVKRDFSFQDQLDKLESPIIHHENYNVCIKNGLSSNEVMANKWLLQMDINSLRSGFKLLQKWNPKQMDDLFVLLQMPFPRLLHLTKKTMVESTILYHENRVYYFAENFEKHPKEVCYHLMHYKFLFTRNFPKLHQIYQTLLENNVCKEDIWKDAWVFMYSIDHINQRIARTKEANVKACKPWIFRCKSEIFERTLEIKQENRVVLNKDSTAQYLAKRLKVPEKTIRYISAKYPTTLRVSPMKLKEILDFLLREGYRPTHILSIPRVFTHSISTLQERLTELKDLGCDPTLNVLCKNKTSYQELVNKLILKNTEQS